MFGVTDFGLTEIIQQEATVPFKDIFGGGYPLYCRTVDGLGFY